ncbi:hypothetical protein N431DRAFT_443468 [Stipitochalara longipes BDJ]|nr:hypothetical protein N431DRAFT_443468 [Stipitochalara longipes BDJ]
MAPTPSTQLIVPSQPQNPLKTISTYLTNHNIRQNPHYKPHRPLSQYLTYPKIQTVFRNTTLNHTSHPLQARDEIAKLDSHGLYNETAHAATETKDASFAKKNGPWVAVLVGVAGLLVLFLLVKGCLRERRRRQRRGVKLGNGRDKEEEGEEHEMGDAVDGVFRVEEVGEEGEGQGRSKKSGEGKMVEVPLS